MFKKFVVVVGALLLAGCANVVVHPHDDTNGYVQGQRYSTKVALRTSSEFLKYAHVGRPSSWAGSAQTYEFYLGQPLADALRNRLAASMHLTGSEESADIIVVPTIQGFTFSLAEDRQKALFGMVGILSGSGPTSSTELNLGLTALSPQGNVLYQGSSAGQGRVTSASSFSFSAERDFTASASQAIGDAAQRGVAQMIADTQIQTLLPR